LQEKHSTPLLLTGLLQKQQLSMGLDNKVPLIGKGAGGDKDPLIDWELNFELKELSGEPELVSCD
jgi:hypothetical protein